MYFVKTPKVVQSLLPKAIWNIPNEKNEVYLTFDDGPTPGITDAVLRILRQHNAQATFFCLGTQVETHQELFQEIQNLGHSIGNHSYSHPKGWTTDNDVYLNDVMRGNEIIKSTLFRPPYGKIKRNQIAQLPKQYKLIMWDVLPGDFSPKVSVNEIIENTLSNVTSGSIIVLHDNDKCGSKMLEALPSIIEGLTEKGFSMASIPI